MVRELPAGGCVVACRFPLPTCRATAVYGAGIDTVWLYTDIHTPLPQQQHNEVEGGQDGDDGGGSGGGGYNKAYFSNRKRINTNSTRYNASWANTTISVTNTCNTLGIITRCYNISTYGRNTIGNMVNGGGSSGSDTGCSSSSSGNGSGSSNSNSISSNSSLCSSDSVSAWDPRPLQSTLNGPLYYQ